LAGIKHCNRLEQVMARAEWDDPAVPEGLMCDARGRVIEGTQTNLFLWRGDELLTPLLDASGVAGVAREVLMGLARAQGIPIRETTLERDQVLAADALLLTNAVIGVWPVRELAGQAYDPVRYPTTLMAGLMERIHRP
jgi:4-amino-4-deoxychorismate lyase